MKCVRTRRKNIDGLLLWCEEAVTFLGRMWSQAGFVPWTFCVCVCVWFMEVPKALVTLNALFGACSWSQGAIFYLQMEGGKCFTFRFWKQSCLDISKIPNPAISAQEETGLLPLGCTTAEVQSLTPMQMFSVLCVGLLGTSVKQHLSLYKLFQIPFNWLLEA